MRYPTVAAILSYVAVADAFGFPSSQVSRAAFSASTTAPSRGELTKVNGVKNPPADGSTPLKALGALGAAGGIFGLIVLSPFSDSSSEFTLPSIGLPKIEISAPSAGDKPAAPKKVGANVIGKRAPTSSKELKASGYDFGDSDSSGLSKKEKLAADRAKAAEAVADRKAATLKAVKAREEAVAAQKEAKLKEAEDKKAEAAAKAEEAAARNLARKAAQEEKAAKLAEEKAAAASGAQKAAADKAAVLAEKKAAREEAVAGEAAATKKGLEEKAEKAKAEEIAAEKKAAEKLKAEKEAEKKAAEETAAAKKAEEQAKADEKAVAKEEASPATAPKPAPAPASEAAKSGLGVVGSSASGGKVLPKEEISADTLSFLKKYQ